MPHETAGWRTREALRFPLDQPLLKSRLTLALQEICRRWAVQERAVQGSNVKSPVQDDKVEWAGAKLQGKRVCARKNCARLQFKMG